MKKLTIGLLAACLPLAASLMPSLAAPSAKDWPAYGHDTSGGRFSPLTQITPQNVGKLAVAWTYHMNPTPGGGRVSTSTTTPLMVDGLLFLGTPYGRVVALDATTGKQVWAYQLPGSDQPRFVAWAIGPATASLRLASSSAAPKAS